MDLSGALSCWAFSPSRRPAPLLLLGWFLGQTAELAIAGAVVGSRLAGRRVWRLFWVVVGLVVVCILATIILQSLGVVSTIRLPS